MTTDAPSGETPQLPSEATLLRIFIGDQDKHDRLPLYEAIVLKAREMHLAGATVLRSPLGFGKSSHVHTSKLLQLSSDTPMVIEIIDLEEKIQTFLPTLDAMMDGGLVTMERVQIIHYRAHQKPGKK